MTTPTGSEMAVTLSGVTEIVILRLAFAVCGLGVSVSVTVTVKLTGPTIVPLGVPVIAPVAGFKFSPTGRLPVVTFQVSTPAPPAACNCVWGYTVPIDPSGSDTGVAFRVGAPTAMLRMPVVAAFVGVCESVRVTVNFEVPVNVPLGVPETTPALLKLKPAGKVPGGTLHL